LAAEKKFQSSEPFPGFAGLIFYEHFGEGGGAGIGSFGWVGAICSWGAGDVGFGSSWFVWGGSEGLEASSKAQQQKIPKRLCVSSYERGGYELEVPNWHLKFGVGREAVWAIGIYGAGCGDAFECLKVRPGSGCESSDYANVCAVKKNDGFEPRAFS
jgi:hypothetical protein